MNVDFTRRSCCDVRAAELFEVATIAALPLRAQSFQLCLHAIEEREGY
jgi:hypothetical protein